MPTDSKETKGSKEGVPLEILTVDTSRSEITFSEEKKACWKFLFKCWRKCSGQKKKKK